MKKIITLLFVTALIVFGCASDYEVLQSYDAVILTADKSNKLVGETITFAVKDNNGTDHTAESTFFVDGQPIEGNTLTAEVTGSHEVTAEFGPLTSAAITVTFGDGTELNFRKRVLIEDYTGTWCGYCTRVAYAQELVMAQTDDVVPVAIHRPSSNPSNAQYDPFNFDASAVENTLSAVGYPKGYLNRRTRWTSPEPNNVAQVINLTQGENPKLGLALSPKVEGNNITLDVNVMFSRDFTGLKLVVYVLENGLIYEQHNYTDYYDSVDVIEDWEHNHVLRASLTDLLGEVIGDENTGTYDVFTRTFNIPVPENVANKDNIEFVVFVLNADNRAVNVRKARAGETQEFEIE